jgi:hypothetical protein
VGFDIEPRPSGDARRLLHAEVADFGYGPAHALVAVLAGWKDQPAARIYSSGNAATFLRKALPQAEHVDLDCASPQNWATFRETVPLDAPVITMSRAFAGFATTAGYRVGLVDQLDWMWQDTQPWERPLAFHIVQAYFGADLASQSRGHLVRPIIDRSFCKQAKAAKTRAMVVIGFGGMSMMGRPDACDDYARWFLGEVLPVVFDEGACESVTVVGGRPDLQRVVPSQWRSDRRVTCRQALDPQAYADLLAGSRYHLMTPGLATIYECAQMEITPLFGPGMSKSMILQLDDLIRTTGYPHVVRWPWHEEMCAQVRQMPQGEALEQINDAVGESITVGTSRWLKHPLRRYLASPPADSLSIGRFDLPDGIEAIRGAVARLMGRN